MTNSNDSGSAMMATDAPKPTLATAVLFLIFNRPDTTAIVFEAIREAKPARLYVAADGARANRPAEAIKCRETRAIIDQVDWPCEVRTLYRNENLGCKRAVSGAITWFFENEVCGIILEDDCVPDPSFFGFCEALLRRYENDERVGQIAGTAFFGADAAPAPQASYRFSRHFSVWGWATWRRAWAGYDPDLRTWPDFDAERSLNSAYPLPNERAARRRECQSIVSGKVDTWDYQWLFANASQSRLSIVPSRNLIVNIGFGADATHTRFRHPIAPTIRYETLLPPQHPLFVIADHRHDSLLSKRLYPGLLAAKLHSLLARLTDFGYLKAVVSTPFARVTRSQ